MMDTKPFGRSIRSTSRKVSAEASAWLARLHSPDRTREVEEGLQCWLAVSPEHAAAFEKATDIWEEVQGISAAAVLRHKKVQRPDLLRRMFGQPLAIGMAALATVVIGTALFLYTPDQTYTTGVGEQRMVTLSDGSRVILNTNTKVVVKPWSRLRELQLVQGEAYFEVAKDKTRPFVIVAGNKKVVAVGTSFVVNRQNDPRHEKLQVTLVQGKVAVTNLEVPPQSVLNGGNKISILDPGQRMVLADAKSYIDKPSLEAITAWRSGKVVLNNTPLKDAVEDFNRYNHIALVVQDEAAANMPVSGIFWIGDSEAFANAVANLYGLTLIKERKQWILAGTPASS